MEPFVHRNLLDIDGLSREEIEQILDTAEAFFEVSRRPVRKVPTLRGKTVINLFYESSTRTRTSPAPGSGSGASLSSSTSGSPIFGIQTWRIVPPFPTRTENSVRKIRRQHYQRFRGVADFIAQDR